MTDDTKPCPTFGDHDFKRTGSHRVPAYGAYSTNMPNKPDGTISYADFKCRRCGQEFSEEELYSWRPNTFPEIGVFV